jgi:hypothetical protein
MPKIRVANPEHEQRGPGDASQKECLERNVRRKAEKVLDVERH